MKRLVLSISLALSAIALPVWAATFTVGQEVTIRQDQVVTDDMYLSAGSIAVSGGIIGDLVAVGGNVLFNGSTTEDVIAGGGAVDVLGPVGDDVRAVGGQVRIGEAIANDAVAAGGLVQLLPSVSVGGDAVLLGGSVVIDGTVSGTTYVYAGDVKLNGTFANDVVVFSSGSVEVGSSATFGGRLEYTAPRMATISESAVMADEVVFHEAQIVNDARSFFQALFGAVFITKIFTLLTAALLLALLFQSFSARLAKTAIEQPLYELIRGFIVFVMLPVVSLLLFLSLLGFLVGGLGFLLFSLMLVFVKVASGITFGALLSKLFLKKIQVNWQWVIVGVTLLQVINLVPYVGFVISSLIFLVTFGALSNLLYQTFWVNR